MYGLNQAKRADALKKIENQKSFLSSHYVQFFSGDKIPLIDLFKNAYINADRYIAEANHRVWSLYNYSKSKNLVNCFVTITLPSEFHPYKTIGRKKVKNREFNKSTPKEASKKLSQYLAHITSNNIYSSIPKEMRCYFRSIEPHKSGVPHTHISFFLPKEKLQSFKSMLSRYSSKWNCQIHVESEIKNPVSYVMKYILKTFDDLREGQKGITDLSLWYVYHGIARFYTSRTLITLDVYRVLNGKYSLFELTQMQKDRAISVFLDTNTSRIMMIQSEYEVLYYRKGASLRSYDEPLQVSKLKFDLKSRTKERLNKSRTVIVEFEDEEKSYLWDKETNLFSEYRKPIYLMRDSELMMYRSKLIEESKDFDRLYFVERRLIRDNVIQKYSPSVRNSEAFWNNYNFEAKIYEEIPF